MTVSRCVAAFAVGRAPRAVCGAVLAVVLVASGVAQAQQPQSPPLPPPQARIIVAGEGSVSAAPDMARISSGVTTRAATAKAATDANSKTMAAIMAALLNAGIAQSDIKTARFSVQPVYESPAPNTVARLTGFSVSNQVSVTIRQIGKVGDILDALIAAGANAIGNIEFVHSDMSKALDQARTAAIADARRKAALYAQAAGQNLGAVVWITEETGLAAPLPAMRALAAAAPVPISAGEDTLRVQVTVGFDVAP